MQFSRKAQDDSYTFRTIVEALPFPVYLCMGENLLVTIANEATLKAWGKTRDIIGKPFHKILPELEDQPFRQLLLDVYYTGVMRSSNDQRADIKVDGVLQTFYFTFSYQPFKDPDGVAIGVFCIANDVTELVLAKDKLAASEESARLAIKAARLGTFDKNLLTGEMFWDARCRELFDIQGEHTVTYEADFLPGLHPDDRERINDHIRNFTFVKEISAGDYDVEYRTIGAMDKKTRWIRSRGKVFFNKQNTPTRFIGTVFDITDIKQADEQGALLAAIINTSNDAIISKNLDGVIESWNDAAMSMFGYSSEEMIGQSIYKIIPPEQHEEERRILSRLKKGEQLAHFETTRLTKDQKLLDISLTISPIKDKYGNITGLSKIARDITEQKMAEKQKNDFITIASHELKTPLTTIKSYVQILLARVRKEDDIFKINALTKVERQADNMSILIQNLLNNAKLADGSLEMEVGRFDVHVLLTEVARNAEVMYQTHKILITECEELFVIADRKKIAQVLNNLISNAVKYSPVGTDIIIDCKKDEGNAQISISDHGIGISRTDQAKMFDRFYRVQNEKVKNVSGFGIGLYLVAEILHFHKSKVYVESKENEGSRFYFDLPVTT